MDTNIIDFAHFRDTQTQIAPEKPRLSPDEIKRLETIRDTIEALLDRLTAEHRDPAAIAFAAGRFAAMRLYQLQGRAATMAFIDQCIETLEISEDMFGNE